MADKKITQLDAVTSPANTDLLLIVRDPSTTPVNKKLEIGDMFGETSQTVFQTVDIKANNDIKLAGDTVYISSNTNVVLNNPLKVNDDRIIIRDQVVAPANSNNSYYAWETGTFAYTSNRLYIAVSPTLITNVKLNNDQMISEFTPANSNNVFYGWDVGTIAYDADYLYIAVSPTTIARFAANSSTSWTS